MLADTSLAIENLIGKLLGIALLIYLPWRILVSIKRFIERRRRNKQDLTT